MPCLIIFLYLSCLCSSKSCSCSPFLQTKSNHNPILQFPAVTVCNQNPISCYNLIDVMFEKHKRNESEDYDLLEKMYLLSNCGTETLWCSEMLAHYAKSFNESEMPPKTLLDEDPCLDCEHIHSEWTEYCAASKNSPPESFGYWWEKLECFEILTQSEDEMEPMDVLEFPESLDECMPNNKEPPTVGGEGNYIDYFEYTGTTSGFSNTSVLSNTNATDSPIDSYESEYYGREDPSYDRTGPRDVQQSTENEYSEPTLSPNSSEVSYFI